MSRLLVKASARHLGRHPWLVILCIVGIAIGVAVVLGIHIAGRSAQQSFVRSAEAVTGRATHAVVGGSQGVPDSVYTRIRVDAGWDLAAPRIEADVIGPAGRPLRLLGIDPLAEAPFRTYLSPGTDAVPSAQRLLGEPATAWVSRDTATTLGIEPGQRFLVSHGTRTAELELIGLLAVNDALGQRALTDVVVVDVASAQEALGRLGTVDRIDLRIDHTADEQRIRAVLPPGVALVPAGTAASQLRQMTAAFDLNLRALSLLALLVGMFLIYNTTTFLVVQRRGLWGSLRAVGVGRGQLFALVLGEVALVATLGSVVGVILGIALAHGLVDLVTQTISDLYYSVSVRHLEVGAPVAMLGVAVGLVTALVAAVVPAWEAAGIAPVTVLRRSDLEGAVHSLVPRLAGAGFVCSALALVALLVPSQSLILGYVGLFLVLMAVALWVPWATLKMTALMRPLAGVLGGSIGRIAIGGVARQLSRTGVAIAALVVAVATALAVGIMIQSFRGSVVQWLDRTLQADVYVSLPSSVARRASESTLSPNEVERIRETPGVDHITTNRTVDALGPNGTVRVIILDIRERHFDAFQFVAGDSDRAWPTFVDGEGVLISEPFSYRTGATVGDRVRLQTAEGMRDFAVVGVALDYQSEQGTVTMHRKTYDHYFSDDRVNAVGVFASSGVTGETLEARLRERFPDTPGLRIRPLAALRAATLEVFDRTFAVTSVLRTLTAVVAFIGVLSALMALQFERLHEFAILRARGLTPGQSWRLVTLQGAWMGVLAGVFAAPLGIALAAILTLVINRRSFGWSLQLDISPTPLLEAVLLAVVAAVLASLLPAHRLARVPLARALREQ